MSCKFSPIGLLLTRYYLMFNYFFPSGLCRFAGQGKQQDLFAVTNLLLTAAYNILHDRLLLLLFVFYSISQTMAGFHLCAGLLCFLFLYVSSAFVCRLSDFFPADVFFLPRFPAMSLILANRFRLL